jgi:hypothetical protein
MSDEEEKENETLCSDKRNLSATYILMTIRHNKNIELFHLGIA